MLLSGEMATVQPRLQRGCAHVSNKPTSVSRHSLTLDKAFLQHCVAEDECALRFDYLPYAPGSHLPVRIDLWGPVADEDPENADALDVAQERKQGGIAWPEPLWRRISRLLSTMVGILTPEPSTLELAVRVSVGRARAERGRTGGVGGRRCGSLQFRACLGRTTRVATRARTRRATFVDSRDRFWSESKSSGSRLFSWRTPDSIQLAVPRENLNKIWAGHIRVSPTPDRAFHYSDLHRDRLVQAVVCP